MKPNKLILILGILYLFSCRSGGEKAKNSISEAEKISISQNLSEYKWLLIELNGRPISTIAENNLQPYIQFIGESYQVNGYAGCNQFTGSYTLKSGNAIEFSKMASTLKACSDMDLENMFFEVIEDAVEWRIYQGELLLGKSTNAPLMRFKPEMSTDVHSSMNSLDWEGVYRGVLPCTDCKGIFTVIYLRRDQTFTVETKYLGKTDETFRKEGQFSWNEDGSIVVFHVDADKSPSQYFVGENYLQQVDMEGNLIKDELKDQYKLKKIDREISEKYWKLIELNGKPLVWKEDFRQEPHIILKDTDGKVIGHGGCNTLNGSFIVSEGNRITFSSIGRTKIGCPDMSVEDDLLQLLEKVDNYSVTSDTLSLQKAKMTPLARFVAVYLR